jgi:hypothetical protein
VLFSNELARRAAAEGSGITSNSLHPGMIKTDLDRHLYDVVNWLPDIFDKPYVAILDWVFTASMVPDVGALTQVLPPLNCNFFVSYDFIFMPFCNSPLLQRSCM